MGPRALVGRARETAALAAFLDEPGLGGLVVTGEPGLGKSALWEHAAALAAERGAVVLRARPGEGEQRHSFGVLHDLFRDVDLDGHRLRGTVRESLAAVLLRESVTSPVDPQLVEVGVHDLLTDLARDRQVVVFVDDTQWADSGSLQALAFAARRLDDVPVRFVLARRAGFERSALEAFLVRRDLRYVEPRLLTVEETARLLAQRPRSRSAGVLRLVHEQSRGNPLFALEIGRVLAETGVPERGEPLGLPDEMAAVFGLRVRGLDRELRTLLLAVALDPQVTEPALVALVGATCSRRRSTPGWSRSTNTARSDPGTPCCPRLPELMPHRFGARSCIARLAKAVDTAEARLRHEALAASEPDDALAERLAAAAQDAGTRGATETAMELAELALARTPRQRPRARNASLSSRRDWARSTSRSS